MLDFLFHADLIEVELVHELGELFDEILFLDVAAGALLS